MKTKKLIAITFISFLSIWAIKAQEFIGTNTGKVIYNFQTQFFHTNNPQNIVIIIIATLGLLIIILDKYLEKNFPYSIKNFLQWNLFLNQARQFNINILIKDSVYGILGIIISSIIFFISYKAIMSLHILEIILTFVLQAFLNFLTSLFINKILSNKEIANIILNSNLSFWKEIVELGYILGILIYFSRSHLIFAIVWTIIWLFFYIKKLSHILKTFSEAKFHLFYFILYLCAVEFMPFLLLFTVFKS